MNHYKILQITANAARSDIRAAYLRLVQESHPDRHIGDPDSDAVADRERFKRIQEAYEVLSDPARRKKYDRSQSVPPRKRPTAAAVVTPVRANVGPSVRTSVRPGVRRDVPDDWAVPRGGRRRRRRKRRWRGWVLMGLMVVVSSLMFTQCGRFGNSAGMPRVSDEQMGLAYQGLSKGDVATVEPNEPQANVPDASLKPEQSEPQDQSEPAPPAAQKLSDKNTETAEPPHPVAARQDFLWGSNIDQVAIQEIEAMRCETGLPTANEFPASLDPHDLQLDLDKPVTNEEIEALLGETGLPTAYEFNAPLGSHDFLLDLDKPVTNEEVEAMLGETGFPAADEFPAPFDNMDFEFGGKAVELPLSPEKGNVDIATLALPELPSSRAKSTNSRRSRQRHREIQKDLARARGGSAPGLDYPTRTPPPRPSPPPPPVFDVLAPKEPTHWQTGLLIGSLPVPALPLPSSTFDGFETPSGFLNQR